jgi:hypothetical protein
MEALTAPGVFTVLADKKRELTGRGVDVIDLSVGSPDNAPAPHVVQAVRQGLVLFREPVCLAGSEFVCRWIFHKYNSAHDFALLETARFQSDRRLYRVCKTQPARPAAMVYGQMRLQRRSARSDPFSRPRSDRPKQHRREMRMEPAWEPAAAMAAYSK